MTAWHPQSVLLSSPSSRRRPTSSSHSFLHHCRQICSRVRNLPSCPHLPHRVRSRKGPLAVPFRWYLATARSQTMARASRRPTTLSTMATLSSARSMRRRISRCTWSASTPRHAAISSLSTANLTRGQMARTASCRVVGSHGAQTAAARQVGGRSAPEALLIRSADGMARPLARGAGTTGWHAPMSAAATSPAVSAGLHGR